MLRNRENLGKFDVKFDVGIFLGYSIMSKAQGWKFQIISVKFRVLATNEVKHICKSRCDNFLKKIDKFRRNIGKCWLINDFLKNNRMRWQNITNISMIFWKKKIGTLAPLPSPLTWQLWALLRWFNSPDLVQAPTFNWLCIRWPKLILDVIQRQWGHPNGYMVIQRLDFIQILIQQP